MPRPVPVATLLRGERVLGRASCGPLGITLGSDLRDDLVDPHLALRRFTLVRRSWRGWRLRVPEGAGAVFFRGGSRLSLSDLAGWGLVKPAKGAQEVRLDPDMAAELSLGDETVRLAFGPKVRPPGAARGLCLSPAGLPRELRRTPLGPGDRLYPSLVLLLCLASAGTLVWLRQVPWTSGVPTLQSMPYRISRLLLEGGRTAAPAAPGLPEGRGAGRKDEAPPAEPTAPEAPVREASRVERPPAGADAGGRSREAIRKQVAKVGVLGVLSGRGTAGRSASRGGASPLQLGADLEQRLDEVLNTVGGIAVVSEAGSGQGLGAGSGQGSGAGLLDIEGSVSAAGVRAPVQVSRLEGSARGVPGGIGEEGDGGSGRGARGREQEPVPAEAREERSTRAIARIVAAHTGALRYAYNRELRKNPALRGKVVLRFTILPQGKVTECAVEESDMNWPPLEEALVRIVLGWEFPAIPEGTVTVSYPLVFFPSM